MRESGDRHGPFQSGSCIKESPAKKPGSYEWFPGAEKRNSRRLADCGILATVAGTSVSCKTEESGGEFNSAKTVTSVVVRFTSCEAAGFTCSTAGAKAGEIVTNPLEGRIGFENKAKKKIALDLFPAATDGGLYVTFNCGGYAPHHCRGLGARERHCRQNADGLTLKYYASKRPSESRNISKVNRMTC